MGAYYDDYWSPGGSLITAREVSVKLRRALRAHISDTSDVLDFGCGDGLSDGQFTAQLASSYLGLDVSQVSVDACRDLGLDARQIVPDAPLPVEDASFDVAIAIEVLEHLVDPQTAIAELQRVLKPGGTLIVTTPNVAYWRRRLDLLMLGRWHPMGDQLSVEQPWRDPHLRFFTRGALSRMLAGAGYVDVSVTGHFGALIGEIPGVRRLARSRSSPVYRGLETVMPSLLGARLLAVGRKAGALP